MLSASMGRRQICWNWWSAITTFHPRLWIPPRRCCMLAVLSHTWRLWACGALRTALMNQLWTLSMRPSVCRLSSLYAASVPVAAGSLPAGRVNSFRVYGHVHCTYVAGISTCRRILNPDLLSSFSIYAL